MSSLYDWAYKYKFQVWGYDKLKEDDPFGYAAGLLVC